MHWYLEVIKKYAVFSGRARREEFWMFFLFNIIVSGAIGGVAGILAAMLHSPGVVGIIIAIYSLAMLIPSIAVSIRRMHDIGRSGWWIIVPVVHLVFLFLDSQPGENEYGSNPKATSSGNTTSQQPSLSYSDTSQSISNQHLVEAPVVIQPVAVVMPTAKNQSTISLQTAVDEDRIYAEIANELETGIVEKGLWTRLFSECGGDEKQTKVLYIKQRAKRLIATEQTRLEQLEHERSAEVDRLEKLRLQSLQDEEKLKPSLVTSQAASNTGFVSQPQSAGQQDDETAGLILFAIIVGITLLTAALMQLH